MVRRVNSLDRQSYFPILWYLLSVLAILSVLFPAAGQAQEGLEDIAFYTLGKDLVIRANFSDVVRYQKHYPAKAGDTLVITLKLVGITDGRNLRDRRISKRPRGIEGIPLRDVTFEVNGTEGPRLVVHFTRKVSYGVRQGKDNRSIDIVVSGVKITRVTQDQDVEKQAAQLFGQGRQALLKKQHRQAIRSFTRVLDLPENGYSADALEFLGVARERSGQRQQAVVEYKLYLKRYPKTEGADRVRQRLLNLVGGSKSPDLKEPEVDDESGKRQIYGTLSQIYYTGNSRIDTTTTVGGVVTELPTLDSTDQSSLATNLDMTARYRSGNYDNRLVFSGDQEHDFLNEEDQSRVRSAYGEIKNITYQYSARVGRQSGKGGGVLGRFDGILAGYNVFPRWRLNAVVGEPVDTIAMGSEREFSGGSLGMGTFAGKWSVSLYQFDQSIDGLTDRQAMGAEYRYFNQNSSIFSIIDYDTFFAKLNILMLQSNWQTNDITYNLLLDYRMNPPLQLSNALMGETVSSIKSLQTLYSDDEIKQLAIDRTAESKLVSFGFVYPAGKRWQLGADVTGTSVAGLPASGTVPGAVILETPGTGNVYTVAPKIIGSNLLFKQDVTVIGASYTDSDLFTANSWFITNRSPYKKWRFNTSIKWYHQDNSSGVELDRLIPSLRIDYRKNNVTFEFEYGQETTHTLSATQEETVTRDFYTLGYRWDF